MTGLLKAKESEKRSRRRKRKVNWLLVIIPAAAAAIVAFSAFAALRGRDSLTVDEPVYTYVNGGRFDWRDGVQLMHKKGETELQAGQVRQNLQDCPLIAEESGRIILQRSGSWNRTSDEAILRLDYFTEIQKTETGIEISRRGQSSSDISGFIYDNEDTYILLEPAVISWGDVQMETEPMTVVRVEYMDDISLFGPGIRPFHEELRTDEVTAEFAGGKRINLASDLYYQPNGEWRLLFMPLDALNTLK